MEAISKIALTSQADRMSLTQKPAQVGPDSQVMAWALLQLRKMETLKPGEPLKGPARDWYVQQIAILGAECGCDAVALAIEGLLLNQKFRPDISEIRAAVSGTAQQADAVQGGRAWVELREYIRRFVTTDADGKWVLRSRRKIVFDDKGQMQFVDTARGRCVKTEAVPMPPMSARLEWTLVQIGGLHRYMETSDEFLEVLRRDFLKAWPMWRMDQEDVRMALPEARDLLALALGGAE